MENPLTRQKEKRQLNYLKCRFCRQSKKKCEPAQRKWPGQKCNRCLEEGFDCSENQRAQGRAGPNTTPAETERLIPNSTPQDLGTAEWKEYYNLSLRVAWLHHVKRYMQSLAPFGLESQDQYFHLPLLPEKEKYDEHTAFLDGLRGSMEQEEEAISQQIVSLLSAAAHSTPAEPLTHCLSRLLLEINDNHGISKSPKYPMAPGDALSKLVDGYVDCQDFATALLIQETIVLGLWGLNNKPVDPDHTLGAVIRYCEIYTSCQEYLSKVCPNGWHLQAAVPPMHALLSLSRDVCFLSLLSAPVPSHTHRTDFFQRTLLHLALDLKLDGMENLPFFPTAAGSLDSMKRLPLHISCLNGQMSTSSALIRLTVESGDVDSQDWRGRTPLHIASAKGHAALVVRLLKSQADIYAVDQRRRTPLYYAVAAGQVSTTSILQKLTPWQDWSAFLRLAIESGNPAVVGIIKDMATTPLSEEIIREALHSTVRNGLESSVDFLLDLYSDINRAAYELYKDGLLRDAARSNKANIAALLIHKHNVKTESRDGMGWTSLMGAANNGCGDVASVLLSSGGADVNYDNFNGDTSLHLAAMWGYSEIVRILLDHGADVNKGDSSGASPLFNAVRCKNLDVVKILLERGADVQLRDVKGRSPLDFCLAAKSPVQGIIDLLEKYGGARDDMEVDLDSVETN